MEQRKQKRVSFTKDVIINNAMMVKGIDISEGGIYVHTGRAFKPESIVDVSIPLPEKTITVKARVQHVEAGVGMGLQFVDLDSEHWLLITDFIDAAQAQPQEQKKKTVLLVDDNAATRRMNTSKLVLDGFGVIEASDGLEALQVLEQGQIDIAIVDLYMEKMDGFKLISLMKQTPQMEHIPIVVLSAKSSPADVEKAKSLGACEFLTKMMTTPLKLSEKIKAIVKK